MDSIQSKQDRLTATTSGLADPRLVLVASYTDIDDPSTWVEVAAYATTNRPSMTSKFGTVAVRNTPDANDQATASEAYRQWPSTGDLDVGAYGGSGGYVELLAIVNGTGALSAATVCRLSDTPFHQQYTATQHIIIAQNSQTSTQK